MWGDAGELLVIVICLQAKKGEAVEFHGPRWSRHGYAGKDAEITRRQLT